MPRERTASIRCGEPGCADCAHYAYASQREYREIVADQKRRPYMCSRHRDPAANLRPGNESTRHVLTATRVRSATRDAWLPGLFWRSKEGESGSGYAYGPGFNAHASDFPEGTRLVVTTQIEMPEENRS